VLGEARAVGTTVAIASSADVTSERPIGGRAAAAVPCIQATEATESSDGRHGMNLWQQRWRQRQRRRAGKQADRRERHGRREQWFLLAGRAAQPGRLPPDRVHLGPIYPPAEAFWADPFLWHRDGRYYVFFEEFRYASARGHISVMELDSEGHLAAEPRPALQEPHHLSYPFLFAKDGELYMVPEKAETQRLDLYRCVTFPERWELAHTLMEGVMIADATLFEHDGLWWLLAAVNGRRLHLNESLCAFYAEQPLTSKWRSHPCNPLLRDRSRARPAGRILRDGDRLFRPSQDCVRRYGHGLNLSEITLLSPARYRERRLWHLSGEAAGGWRAMHHMDWNAGLLVMDAQRLIPCSAKPPWMG
jgi:hypothetical protein